MQTDLFGYDSSINLLPCDGEVYYFGRQIDNPTSYLNRLLETVPWKQDEMVLFGKHIITERKIAWYAEDNYTYAYSNTSKEALPWTPILLELKKIVEDKTGVIYNSCLLNLYHNGNEGVSWHSDDEKEMKPEIASLTLGAERRFVFKHKHTKETISLALENGSLLLMKGKTQMHWLHALPKTKKVVAPRINLTFRNFQVAQ
jgi:alkylated DNA repair dioxygenase AlkB